MKILYMFRSLAVWGGIERVLVEKMNHLVSVYGYDVYMVTTDQGNHPVPYQLDKCVHLVDLNIRFHQQYQYPLPKRLCVARKLRKLYRIRLSDLINSIKPDVIVCTTADDISSLVKLKGSIPLIVESHSICLRTIEFGKYWLQKKWYRFNYLRALSKVDVLVALTEGDAKEWRKYHPHVAVIPNIVHLNENDTYSSCLSKSVIFVGRLSKQKNIGALLDIWKFVHFRNTDWKLHVYGEVGDVEKNVYDRLLLASDIGVVVHKPIKEQMIEEYKKHSILVLTSIFEPFGLVLPEAMSCGLPVVSFDCPYGPADIITDGVDGFLIKNRDVNEFANRVCQLIKDRELRVRMGQAAVKSAQRYRPDLIMPKWKELFERLCQKE